MTPKELIPRIATAIAAHEALPEIDIQLNLSEAYALQHQVVAQRSPEGVGGIKVGVTTQAAQQFFGLEHALLGSLYAGARLASGAHLPYIEGRSLEIEYAVMVDAEGQPKAIAPAIEVVYVRFARKADMRAENLVLCNLGADLIIVGEFLPWDTAHPQVQAKMQRDSEDIGEADMNDALGGPAQALPWVLSEVAQRGHRLDADTLIMMGACGPVLPAQRGEYHVDYGAMGSLHFSIS